MKALVAFLAAEEGDGPRWESVVERYAGGETITEIAASLRVPYGLELWTPSRPYLSEALWKNYETEMRAARTARGEEHAELQLTAVKNAPETREGIAKARELANAHRWLAAKHDPATYGDAPVIALQVNNPGNLFLQAVARPGALPPAPKEIESGDARGVGTAPQERQDDDAEPEGD